MFWVRFSCTGLFCMGIMARAYSEMQATGLALHTTGKGVAESEIGFSWWGWLSLFDVVVRKSVVAFGHALAFFYSFFYFNSTSFSALFLHIAAMHLRLRGFKSFHLHRISAVRQYFSALVSLFLYFFFCFLSNLRISASIHTRQKTKKKWHTAGIMTSGLPRLLPFDSKGLR